MATAETIYVGELRTRATHIASGETLITDAPVDNKGRGEAFSPTDLFAASLGSCMLTIMGIAADARKINIDGTKISIKKIMASNPRRVSQLQLAIDMPNEKYTPEQREALKYAALNCPVAKSIHPDITLDVAFNFID